MNDAAPDSLRGRRNSKGGSPTLEHFYAGKIAVVTGAGSGIGQAIARLLASNGARVHCADIDAVAVAATVDGIGNAQAHVLDVSDASAVGALADAIHAGEGRVDLLFNNAGIGHAARILDTELEDWRSVLNVNVMGVVHGIHAFLPHMLEQGTPAHIVNTASGAGLFPHPRMAAYSASKHAIVGLSTSLAAELAGSNVAVTILCPGIVNTAIARTTRLRGDALDRRAHTLAYYERNGVTAGKVALDLLNDVRRSKLFCLTPRMQVGMGWFAYRISPMLAISLMRAQIKKVLGDP